MTLDDMLRGILRDEIRAVVREELKSQLPAKQAAPPSGALLRTEDVAATCQVEPDAVRSWIRSGRLVARKAGGHYLVRPADLERFLENEKSPTSLSGEEHMAQIMTRIRGLQ